MAKTTPIIIAMKGHPGTGKTTLATAIAKSLHFPLLDKDDIRDATLSLSTSSTLNDFSYTTLWRVVSTQLALGLSVIIDSPLSSRTRLDEILALAARTGHKVVVVECGADDEGEWRRRVEERGGDGGDGGGGWHKPATWRDMERLLEGYDGCTEYDVGDVPKLVVDTTGSGGIEAVLESVLSVIEAHYCSRES